MHEQPQPLKKQKVSETNGSSSKAEKVEKTVSTVKTKGSSIEEGKKMFEWLLTPLPVDEFLRFVSIAFDLKFISESSNNFSKYWEKKPKLIKRSESRNFYGSLLSTQMIETMLRDNYLEYTKNIDITSYRDGVRETHNPEGRAVSSLNKNFNFKMFK